MPAAALANRRYTVDEILAMQEAGVFSDNDNFELIDGELIATPAKYHAHELIKSKLGMVLSRACPPGLLVGFETSIKLSDDTIVEPDLAIFPEALGWPDLRGPDVLLAIEVADASLAHDLGVKARLYARHGVPDYWVVDANARDTWIHTGPGENGWASRIRKPPQAALTFSALPAFGLALDSV